VSGLKDVSLEGGVLAARLSAEAPLLETAGALSVAASRESMFHFILKNGTASGFVKLSWKKDGTDYNEADSVRIPVVPNDDRFREYSYNLGSDGIWNGTITGLRLSLADGHVDAGALSLHTAEIRTGYKRLSTYEEPLDIEMLGAGGMSGTVLPQATATPTPAPTAKPDGRGGTGKFATYLLLGLLGVLAATGSFLFGIGMAKKARVKAKKG
jgi:hypothetical protein